MKFTGEFSVLKEEFELHKGLLTQLLWENRNIRWFSLLAYLETGDPYSFEFLLAQLGTNRRYLERDLVEMEQYFSQSIYLKTEGDTAALKLKDPLSYNGKKQELLEQEPILRILHQLFLGSKRSRKEWEHYLRVPPATFYQQRKQLNKVLNSFSIQVSPNDLNLIGAEANIRYFYFVFYFSMPDYPSWIEATRQILMQRPPEIQFVSEFWPIDHQAFICWHGITKQRLRLGAFLEVSSRFQEICEKFAKSFWQEDPQLYPVQESSWIFLYSIYQAIQKDQSYQERFATHFCTNEWFLAFKKYVQKKFSDESEKLIGAVGFAFFFEQIFSESTLLEMELQEDSINTLLSAEGEAFVARCVMADNQKVNQNRTILFDWQLEGPLVLQEWIQEKVLAEINTLGIDVVHPLRIPKSIDPRTFHNVTVTNTIWEKEGGTNLRITVSYYPSAQEILMLCRQLVPKLQAIELRALS